MKEFKRIVNKGNIKPMPPSPPKPRLIKEAGLFDWISEGRVKFIFRKRKELIELEYRVCELEKKVSEILPDFN